MSNQFVKKETQLIDDIGPGLFYALMRFEEASLAMRVALQLQIVDRIGDGDRSLSELREELGFTQQAARTYVALLVAMRVLTCEDGRYRVTKLAQYALSSTAVTSRVPYLAIGIGDDVADLISWFRGDTNNLTPLYGREGQGETLMDDQEVAQAIALGLASRARNFAAPLAAAIAESSRQAKWLADVGAGSPYVAASCLKVMPHLERAILVDRANGLRYARHMAAEQPIDLDRIEFLEQDFFEVVPTADIYCVSNTAHDWRREDYRRIMQNIRAKITDAGKVCIHEPLLLTSWQNDREWIHALWMACYAQTLFKLTAGQGSCYTEAEHDAILRESGFARLAGPVQTSDGCTALFYQPV